MILFLKIISLPFTALSIQQVKLSKKIESSLSLLISEQFPSLLSLNFNKDPRTLKKQLEKSLEATQKRIQKRVRSPLDTQKTEEVARLTSRLENIKLLIREYSATTTPFFLVGHGTFCDIKSEKYQGISEFNGYITFKNGEWIYTDINSSYKCFTVLSRSIPTKQSIPDLPKPKRTLHVPSPSFVSTVSKPIEAPTQPQHSHTLLPSENGCGHCNDDVHKKDLSLFTKPRFRFISHSYQKLHESEHQHEDLHQKNHCCSSHHDGKKHRHHHHHHHIQGVCVCGRSAGSIMAPNTGGAHANESGASHAVYQFSTNQGGTSPFGFIVAGFIPIKMILDYKQAKAIPHTYVHFQEHREICTQLKANHNPETLEASPYYHYQNAQLDQNRTKLQEAAINLGVSSPLFYTGAVSNITGTIQAFVAGTGGVAQAISAFSFGALGGVTALEGSWPLYKTINLPDLEKIHSQRIYDQKLEDISEAFQEVIKKDLRNNRIKQGFKIGGGTLTVVALTVPGAQPAIIPGIILLMAYPAKALAVWLKQKLWTETPHPNFKEVEQWDYFLRLLTFKRLDTIQTAAQSFYDWLSKTESPSDEDIRKKLTDYFIKKHQAILDDFQAKKTYLNDSIEAIDKSSDLYKTVCNELKKLNKDIEKEATVIANFNQEMSKTDFIKFCESQETFISQVVVPKSRGILNRFWNKNKINLLFKRGLVQETTKSSWAYRRYELIPNQEEIAWDYFFEQVGLKKELLKWAHQQIHEAKHKIEHLGEIENQARKAWKKRRK